VHSHTPSLTQGSLTEILQYCSAGIACRRTVAVLPSGAPASCAICECKRQEHLTFAIEITHALRVLGVPYQGDGRGPSARSRSTQCLA
jgi:hypothetical protein